MLDGVGIGPTGPQNPLTEFATGPLATLGVSRPADAATTMLTAHPIDATLGVLGLPQSGTGQASLVSGVNAARQLGHHSGPWPGPSLYPLLDAALPARVYKAGGRVGLANAYPPAYHAALLARKVRLNSIARAALAGGAIQSEQGLHPALGRWTPGVGLDDDLDAAAEAARALLTDASVLTIFDAWVSDRLGHQMHPEPALQYARRLNEFFGVLLENISPDALLVITSDHGNFEDLSVKTHTTNPTPMAAVGPGAHYFAGITDLTGVAPAISAALGLADHPE